MDLKKNWSSKRSLDNSSASYSNSKKRPNSAKKLKNKDHHQNNASVVQSFADNKKKKGTKLTKKKI